MSSSSAASAGAAVSFSSSSSSTESAGEIVDEVERVLDLVRDAGGQLAERGHLLGLDQLGLRRLQIAQRRLRRVARGRGCSSISRAFSIAITACAAKFCSSAICLSENGRTSGR